MEPFPCPLSWSEDSSLRGRPSTMGKQIGLRSTLTSSSPTVPGPSSDVVPLSLPTVPGPSSAVIPSSSLPDPSSVVDLSYPQPGPSVVGPASVNSGSVSEAGLFVFNPPSTPLEVRSSVHALLDYSGSDQSQPDLRVSMHSILEEGAGSTQIYDRWQQKHITVKKYIDDVSGVEKPHSSHLYNSKIINDKEICYIHAPQAQDCGSGSGKGHETKP